MTNVTPSSPPSGAGPEERADHTDPAQPAAETSGRVTVPPTIALPGGGLLMHRGLSIGSQPYLHAFSLHIDDAQLAGLLSYLSPTTSAVGADRVVVPREWHEAIVGAAYAACQPASDPRGWRAWFVVGWQGGQKSRPNNDEQTWAYRRGMIARMAVEPRELTEADKWCVHFTGPAAAPPQAAPAKAPGIAEVERQREIFRGCYKSEVLKRRGERLEFEAKIAALEARLATRDEGGAGAALEDDEGVTLNDALADDRKYRARIADATARTEGGRDG